MSDESGVAGEQGDLVSRLRAVIGAKDEQIAVLAAGLEVSRERERRLELRLAEAAVDGQHGLGDAQFERADRGETGPAGAAAVGAGAQ